MKNFKCICTFFWALGRLFRDFFQLSHSLDNVQSSRADFPGDFPVFFVFVGNAYFLLSFLSPAIRLSYKLI